MPSLPVLLSSRVSTPAPASMTAPPVPIAESHEPLLVALSNPLKIVSFPPLPKRVSETLSPKDVSCIVWNRISVTPVVVLILKDFDRRVLDHRLETNRLGQARAAQPHRVAGVEVVSIVGDEEVRCRRRRRT